MSENNGGIYMAEFTKFRSAISGFNRADVSEYIEALCAKHQSTLQDMQNEIEILTQQLAKAQNELEEQTAREVALQQELDATKIALKSTEDALDEAMVMLTTPPEEPEEEDAPDYVSMELEAYRRAEAMERASADRSARVNQQLNELLDQISGRYEQTGSEIQVLTEDIRINLKRLEEALSDLDVIFDETTQSFGNLDVDEPISMEE